MGFREAKKQLLHCIDDGNIQHEVRDNIDVKNLLFAGVISMDDVREAILRARGDDYNTSPHHLVKEIDVHVIKVQRGVLKDWYIKWYFIEPDAWFISVHS